jgi:hypothetical protein
MRWLLRLYPSQWRERYGEEFAEILATQRTSMGLVLDVIAGAIDAHKSPQIQQSNPQQIQQSELQQTQGGDRMTLAMLQRCAAGGPKLSPDERRIASRLAIFSALAMATLYVVLTKIYRDAPAVQAVIYTSICSGFAYKQVALMRDRSWRTRAFVLAGEVSAV